MLPSICNKPPRSYAGAMRQYRAALRAYKLVFAGGGSFGWDFPTMRANSPETYAKIAVLIAYMSAHQQRTNNYQNIPA